MTSIKRFTRSVKTIYQDIRNMRKIRELFLYPKEQTLTFLSFFLVTLWMFAPVYRLLDSLTLEFHDKSFYFVNDSILARNLSHYLQQIGYFGLFIGLFTISRSIIYAKDHHVKIRQYIKDHIIPVLLVLFLFLSFFSALFSTNPSISFYGHPYRKEGFVTYLAYAGLFMSAYQLRSLRHLRCLLYPLITSAFILGIFTLIDLDVLNNLFTLTKQTSIFHNANHYAYFLNITILATTILIFLDQKKHMFIRIMYFMILSLLTYTLVENGSFGSYIGSLSGMIFLSVIVLLYKKNDRLTLLFIILTFVLSSLFSSMDTNFLSNELSKIVDNTGDIIEGNDEAPNAGSGRWSLWTNAINFTSERPIFGYGLDNLGEGYSEVGLRNDRAHNEYLQIAASMGIPALLTYLAVLLIHFIRFLKQGKTLHIGQIALYATIFAYLAGAFFGNSMYYTTPYYIILLALSITLNKKSLA